MKHTTAVLFLITLSSIPTDTSAQRIALAKNDGCFVHDQFPVHRGHVDYRAFITGSRIFCDKTLLIPKLLLDEEAKVIVITYPRKWGKSLTLEMIKYFLHHQLDTENKPQPPEKTDSYKIFKEGRLVEHGAAAVDLQSPLLISQHEDFLRQYHARYPVIFLDLSEVRGKDGNLYIQSIRKEIAHAYRCHLAVYEFFRKQIDNEEVGKYERERAELLVRRFVDMTSEEQPIGMEALKSSLVFLCELVNEYYDVKPYVVIDDYDLPFTTQLVHKEHDPDIGESVKFYTEFLKETLDNNQFMERAILSGTLPLNKQQFISSKKTVKQYNILTSPLYEFFGYTQGELEAAFDHLEITSEQRQKFYYLHRGYRMRRDSDAQLYNPLKVAEFLTNPNTTADIWIDDGFYHKFVQNTLNTPSFENAISILLTGSSYPIHLCDLCFSDDDYDTLNYLQHNTHGKMPTRGHDCDTALRYLFAIGYLTLSDNYTSFTNPSETYFRISNNHTRSALQQITIEHFLSKFPFSGEDVDAYLKNISRNLEIYTSQDVFAYNDLNEAVENYLKLIPPFNEVQKTTKRVMRGTVETVRSLFNYFLLYTDYFQFIPHEFAYWKNESLRSDPVFRNHIHRGSMFEFRFNKQFQGGDLVSDAERCKKALQNYKDVYNVKLIGINVRTNKTVQICGIMHANAIDPLIQRDIEAGKFQFNTIKMPKEPGT